MKASEQLHRAAQILKGLADGLQPNARILADAPLAEAWSTLAGEDLCRIDALVLRPCRQGRCMASLLAIDEAARWAFVLHEGAAEWWLLGDQLPGGPAPDDQAVERARAWIGHRLSES